MAVPLPDAPSNHATDGGTQGILLLRLFRPYFWRSVQRRPLDERIHDVRIYEAQTLARRKLVWQKLRHPQRFSKHIPNNVISLQTAFALVRLGCDSARTSVCAPVEGRRFPRRSGSTLSDHAPRIALSPNMRGRGRSQPVQRVLSPTSLAPSPFSPASPPSAAFPAPTV